MVVRQHVIWFLDFLLLYLSCSQIWLNPLVTDQHFWSNMRLLKKKLNAGLQSIFLGANFRTVAKKKKKKHLGWIIKRLFMKKKKKREKKSHLTIYRQWVPYRSPEIPKKILLYFLASSQFWPIVLWMIANPLPWQNRKKKIHACSLLFYWQNFSQKEFFFCPFYDIAKVMIIHQKVLAKIWLQVKYESKKI